jgi:hypothetical protein
MNATRDGSLTGHDPEVTCLRRLDLPVLRSLSSSSVPEKNTSSVLLAGVLLARRLSNLSEAQLQGKAFSMRSGMEGRAGGFYRLLERSEGLLSRHKRWARG